MTSDSMRSLASSTAASLHPALELDLLLDLLDLDLDLVLCLEGDRLLHLPPEGNLDPDWELLYSTEYSLSPKLSSLKLLQPPSLLSMMNSEINMEQMKRINTV